MADAWPMIEQCFRHQLAGLTESERAELGLIGSREETGQFERNYLAPENPVGEYHPLRTSMEEATIWGNQTYITQASGGTPDPVPDWWGDGYC